MAQAEPNRPSGDLSFSGIVHHLKVSNYDQASGMLLALLTTVGSIVFVMLMVWLSCQITTSMPEVEVEFLPPGDSDEAPWGPGNDVEPPPVEESEFMEEEPMEQVEVLNAVVDTNAVADLNAVAVRPATVQRADGRIGGHGKGGGGTGTGRKGGANIIVRFAKGLTVEEYARQLDSLGVELAVWETDGVHYAYNLTKARPDSRVGAPDEETKLGRLNLYATSGDELLATDRELLRRAGIVSSRSVMKFLPKKWAGILRQLQENAAGGRKVQSIRYLVVSDGQGGFTFEVVGQPTFR